MFPFFFCFFPFAISSLIIFLQKLQYLTPDLPEAYSLSQTAEPEVPSIKQPLSASLPSTPTFPAINPILRANAPAFTPISYSPFPNNSPNLYRSLSAINGSSETLSQSNPLPAQPSPLAFPLDPSQPTLPIPNLLAPNLTAFPQSLYSSFPFNHNTQGFNPALFAQLQYPIINPNFPPYLNFNSFPAPKYVSFPFPQHLSSAFFLYISSHLSLSSSFPPPFSSSLSPIPLFFSYFSATACTITLSTPVHKTFKSIYKLNIKPIYNLNFKPTYREIYNPIYNPIYSKPIYKPICKSIYNPICKPVYNRKLKPSYNPKKM